MIFIKILCIYIDSNYLNIGTLNSNNMYLKKYYNYMQGQSNSFNKFIISENNFLNYQTDLPFRNFKKAYINFRSIQTFDFMSRDQGYDHLIKLLMVGNSGVGKTNMLLRYCEDNFLNSHLSTIGIDFKTKTIEMDNKKLRVQIWDTAGQQRFRTITQTYYRGAMGVFLIYAVNERQSFEEITNWFHQTKLYSAPNVIKVLIGNKADNINREVSYEQGEKLAQQFKMPFFQTSAKSNTNIEKCFLLMIRQIKDTILSLNKQLGVVTYTGSKLHDNNQKQQKSKKQTKCCEN